MTPPPLRPYQLECLNVLKARYKAGKRRRDCLDHLLVWDERQAERLLREYTRYYKGRPHRGLRLQPPAGEKWLPPAQPPPSLSVRGTPILGGLHHRYGTANGVLLTG